MTIEDFLKLLWWPDWSRFNRDWWCQATQIRTIMNQGSPVRFGPVTGSPW